MERKYFRTTIDSLIEQLNAEDVRYIASGTYGKRTAEDKIEACIQYDNLPPEEVRDKARRYLEEAVILGETKKLLDEQPLNCSPQQTNIYSLEERTRAAIALGYTCLESAKNALARR